MSGDSREVRRILDHVSPYLEPPLKGRAEPTVVVQYTYSNNINNSRVERRIRPLADLWLESTIGGSLGVDWWLLMPYVPRALPEDRRYYLDELRIVTRVKAFNGWTFPGESVIRKMDQNPTDIHERMYTAHHPSTHITSEYQRLGLHIGWVSPKELLLYQPWTEDRALDKLKTVIRRYAYGS